MTKNHTKGKQNLFDYVLQKNSFIVSLLSITFIPCFSNILSEKHFQKWVNVIIGGTLLARKGHKAEFSSSMGAIAPIPHPKPATVWMYMFSGYKKGDDYIIFIIIMIITI